MDRLNVSESTKESLREWATQIGCSVDDLLVRLLEGDDGRSLRAQKDFELLTNHIPGVVYRIQVFPRLRFEYVSSSSASVLGYTPEECYAAPELFYHLVHPDDIHLLEAARYSPSDEPTILRWIHRDGSIIWMEQSHTPITNEVGDVVALEGVAYDITRHKQVEGALRESAESYQMLTNLSTDWTYWEKPDGRMHYVSPACEDIIGYTQEEVQQEHLLMGKLVVPEDRPVWAAHRHETPTNTEPRRIQFRVRHKNGTIRWIEHTCLPVITASGEFDGYRVSNADITDRKDAEAALRQAEAHYKLLNDVAFEGIILHRNGVAFDVNQSFVRMFGYDRDELIGKQIVDLLFTPKSIQRIHHNIQRRYMYPYEVEGIRKDGSRLMIEIEARQVGSELRVASLRDITHRKEVEAAALENERLQAHFQKEREHNALIQRIISALSHDLRTSLAVISLSRETLSSYGDRISEEKRQQKLAAIDHHVQFALDLLDDTVQMARGNMAEDEFDPAPVNLALLCRVSVEQINEAYKSSHKLRFIPISKVETANVDEILISRILMNLLSNAIKYSPAGSEIYLELEERGDYVVLRVTDQGVGISPEELPHVFDPFYRVDSVRHIHGTGLGLSIVKDCVSRHRGDIYVESEVDQGTTFIVELPNA